MTTMAKIPISMTIWSIVCRLVAQRKVVPTRRARALGQPNPTRQAREFLPLCGEPFIWSAALFRRFCFSFCFLSFIWSAALFRRFCFSFLVHILQRIASRRSKGTFWMAWQKNKSGGKVPHSK